VALRAARLALQSLRTRQLCTRRRRRYTSSRNWLLVQSVPR
jgi:hypothetical protein